MKETHNRIIKNLFSRSPLALKLFYANKMICFVPIEYVFGLFYEVRNKIEENKYRKLNELICLLIIMKISIFMVIKN